MYDINRALRKLRPLVRQMARSHAIPGSIRMTKEDLEAEGLLVMVRCCKKFHSGNFEHYFARSFRNTIDKIRNYGRRTMRQGIELPIEILEDPDMAKVHTSHLPGSKAINYNGAFIRSQEFVRNRNEQKVIEDRKYRAKRALPLLSSKAARLLQMVIDPRHTAEAEEQAYNEYLRRNHLRALGIRCPGRSQFRLTKRHFRKALKMSRKELRSAIREIRSVDSTLQEGGSRWPRSK